MGLKIRKQESVKQASRIFTDREEPRKSFWKSYNDFKNKMEEGEVKVLAYYGIGGIGKSSLLRKLITEMDESKTTGKIKESLHVYFDLNVKQESRSVLENIRNKLIDDYGFDFPLFDLGCFAYAKKIGETIDKPEVKSLVKRSRVLETTLAVAKDIPVVGLAAKIFNLVDTGLAVYKNLFNKHKDEFVKIENKSAEDLYKYLPILFAKDLTECTKNCQEPLVVFLDTYEQIVNEMAAIGEPLNNDLWLRDEINGLIVNSPKVLWVIAGREKLKWQQFTAWDESLEQHILGTLSETDANNFLYNAGIDDEQLRHRIYELTQGTPVYLDLCVDRYCSLKEYNQKPAIEDFGKNIYALIERFARYMDDSKKDIVYMLSCLKVWTDDMIREIGAKILPNFSTTTYEKVKGFSFIIESEKGRYNIHQTVGESLYQNCPESIRQSTITEAIEYSKNKLEDTNVFNGDYEYYVGWLIKYAMGYFTDDEELRKFYKENIRKYLKKMSDVRRFDAIDELYEPFWERASRNQESRLFALAMKDYSIWLQSKGRYQEALDIAKKSYELYVKILGEKDAATLSAQREYAMGLYQRGMYKESLEIRQDILAKRIELLGEESLETIESYVDLRETYNSLGQYQKELDCAFKIYQLRNAILPSSDPLVFKARNYFVDAYKGLGQYQKAYSESSALILDAEKILGKDNEITLDLFETHAEILKVLGRYEDVLALRKEIYERRLTKQGENHPNTLTAKGWLARAYIDLGRYGDALPIRRYILEKRRTLYGSEHPRTLDALWNVAHSLEKLGHYQEALPLRQEVYESYKRTQGEDYPKTITAHGNIAIDYESLGQYDKALEIRKEVYERRRKLQGENHPKTLDAARSLSSAYVDLGQFAEALPFKQMILEKRKVLYGNDHPKTLKAIWGEAYVLEQMGRYQDALPLRQEIYESYKRTQGEDFPDTITAYGNIAIDYKSLGRYDKALKIRKDVYERRRKLLGEEHPETWDAIINLSTSYIDLGQYTEALPLRQLVLENRKNLFGVDHPKTLDAIWKIAYVLEQMGRYQEALTLRQNLYEDYKRTLGYDFAKTIDAYGCIATDYKSLGQYDKALEIRKEVYERRRMLQGENHPETLGAKGCLADAYIDSILFDEAIALRKELLVKRRELTGESSLKTIAALNSLAWAYFLKGTPEEGIPYAEEMKNKMVHNPNVGERTRINDLDTLALLYASANRLNDAYELATKILQDSITQYATDEKFIAARQYALAFVLNKMDKQSEALDLAQKAYNTRLKYLGEFNEATKRTYDLLTEIKCKEINKN